MTSTTVTVVIPCYNYGKYLAACLRSIHAQTFKDYEIIIVDDGSTDDSGQVAAAHKSLFGKRGFRYIYQKNAGVSAARNAGIRAARGEFITFLDADDVWLPTYLERQVEVISSSTRISLCYTWRALLDNKSRDRSGELHDPIDPVGPSLTTMLLENPCSASGVITRIGLIRKLGGFDRRFSSAADWHMWLRLAASGRVEGIREPLVLYRIHPDAMSGDNHLMNMERVRIFREVYQANRHRLAISSKTKRFHLGQLEYNVVMGHIHRKEWLKAGRRLFLAMLERPFWWRLYAQSVRTIYFYSAEKIRSN